MVRLRAAAATLYDYAGLLSALADNLPVRGVELMQQAGGVRDLAEALEKMAGWQENAGRIAANFGKARK